MVTSNSRTCFQSAQTAPMVAIVKGAGIGFIGSLVGSIAGYLSQFILARNLKADHLGLFFLGLGIFRIAEKIAELGLPNGLMRYAAIFQGSNDEERLKGAILLCVRMAALGGIATGTMLYFISEIISIRVFHKPDLGPVLMWFAFMIPFSTITTIFVFAIQGLKIIRYKVYVREFFEPLSKVLLISLFMTCGLGLDGVLLAYIVPTILGSLLAFSYLKKVFPKIGDRRLQPLFESRKMLDYSWPFTFIYFSGILLLWVDIFFVGYFRSSQEVGVYSVAQKTALWGGIIIASFNSIFAPIVSELYHQKEWELLNHLLKMVTKWIFILAYPVYLVAIFFAQSILAIFGSPFVSGANALIILSIGFLIHSGTGPVGLLMTMTGRTKLQLINVIGALILDVFLHFILIPKYGIVGAALGTAISLVLLNAVNVVEAFVLLGVLPFHIDLLKSLFVGTLSFLTFFYFVTSLLQIENALFLCVGIFLFFLVYLVVNFWASGAEDRLVLAHLSNRLIPWRNRLGSL